MAEIGEVILKLKMLRLYGWRGRKDWIRDVLRQEGSSRQCCSGYDCGCGGADYVDMWTHLWKNRKRFM